MNGKIYEGDDTHQPGKFSGSEENGGAGGTCTDAVEVSWRQIVDPASLELKGAGTVDGRDGRVALLHPVHQPLDLAVTAERVPPQVPETHVKRTANGGLSGHRSHSSELSTHRSVRMSRCLKRSRGSCCRLLFESDLRDKPRGGRLKRFS